MTEPNTPQIVVNSNPLPDQIGTGVRDVVVIVSTASAVLALIKSGDMNGVLALIQTPDALAAISVVVGGAVVLWRQFLSRRETRKKVTIAGAAPEDVTVK